MSFLEVLKREPNGELVRIDRLEIDEVVNAGQISTPVVLYVKNNTNYQLLDIHIYADDKDVEITPSVIKEMAVNDVVEVTFVWHPKLKRDKPLSTRIMSTATKVVKPKW